MADRKLGVDKVGEEVKMNTGSARQKINGERIRAGRNAQVTMESSWPNYPASDEAAPKQPGSHSRHLDGWTCWLQEVQGPLIRL